MHRPHVPIERDICAFIIEYRRGGGDPSELLSAIGKAFPGCTYLTAGRAINLADGRERVRGAQ
jgi:hypothetical protein